MVHQHVAQCSHAQTPRIRPLRTALSRDITEDHELADEESATRPPLNYGEAAIVLPGIGCNGDHVSRFFQTLYEGLSKDQRAWMPYEDPETRFPLTFHPFDDALNKDNDLMMAINTPRAIPVNILAVGRTPTPLMNFITHQHWLVNLLLGSCRLDSAMPMW